MNKNLSSIAGVILVSAILVFSGCTDKATGGGQFISTAYPTSGHKVTFAFNINLKDNQGAVNNDKTICGSFQLVDHDTKLKFHVNEMIWIEPARPSYPPGAYFYGKDKDGYWVYVYLYDLEPVYMEIYWYGSPYTYWYGYIEHGHIQYHE